VELFELYKTSKKYLALSDSRKEKYDIAWKKLETLWFWKIDMLTTFDLQNAVDSNADTYYTARDLKNLLSKLYQMALPDEFVRQNLSDYIELPPLNAKQQQAFRSEEIAALWNDYTSGNWWTGYILLMIYTGMMPGELLDARKDNIDWEGRQIVGAGKKTKERTETPIVLADFILPVLADLCEHTAGDKLIRINKDKFYDTYYEVLERAGCRRLTPYSCRHTAATTLALENIPPSIIQKIMRHAKFSTTEKYIHINIEPMREAINMLQKKKTEGTPLAGEYPP
jgi:integrase